MGDADEAEEPESTPAEGDGEMADEEVALGFEGNFNK